MGGVSIISGTHLVSASGTISDLKIIMLIISVFLFFHNIQLKYCFVNMEILLTVHYADAVGFLTPVCRTWWIYINNYGFYQA